MGLAVSNHLGRHQRHQMGEAVHGSDREELLGQLVEQREEPQPTHSDLKQARSTGAAEGENQGGGNGCKIQRYY